MLYLKAYLAEQHLNDLIYFEHKWYKSLSVPVSVISDNRLVEVSYCRFVHFHRRFSEAVQKNDVFWRLKR